MTATEGTDPVSYAYNLQRRADAAASRVFDDAVAEAQTTGGDPAAILHRRMLSRLRAQDLFTRAGSALACPPFLEDRSCSKNC